MPAPPTPPVTLDQVIAWVKEVLDEELAHVPQDRPAEREARLRTLREIELTARLRSKVGGLDTLMSARGADIGSTNPPVDLQVKFPNYWQTKKAKPLPIPIDQIEKDLTWLTDTPEPSTPRYLVVFLPCRQPGYSVQRKKSNNAAEGKRRLQHAFSVGKEALSSLPLSSSLLSTIGEEVPHTTTKKETTYFRQFRELDRYEVDGPPFRIATVGNARQDLIWALVCARAVARQS